jgi:membrane peptidoglycan carboxypeptidase
VGVVTLIVFVVTPIGVGVAGYNYYDKQLSLDTDYSSVRFETTHIYDRNNVLLYEKLSDQGSREYISYKDVPQVLIDATTAAEDPTFFSNSGFDVYAIARAFYINLSGSGSSGASTITQQVARLIYLPPELRTQLTFDRKVREIVLAIKLSQKFTKEQIMEKYLNQIFYGDLNYGIEAAAKGYFGKSAKDLNLAEASMLAGLPQRPTDYNPKLYLEVARERQKNVLRLMVQYNKITQDQADQAYSFDIAADLANGKHDEITKVRCPHFVDYVLEQLSGQIDSPQLEAAGLTFTQDEWRQGGYEVYTTIDVNLEEAAEKAAQQRINDLKSQNASNAALVAIKPQTGEILAMMGSIDYNNTQIDGQVNVATRERQPGSALKPLTYAVALTDGWTPATILADVSTRFPGASPGQVYVPHDFDGKERGPVTLRNALGSSLNIPAVEALKFDGVQNMMDEATKMGVQFKRTAQECGLTATLGGCEVRLLDLTGAYSVFDNLGYRVPPVSILKIIKHGQALPIYQLPEPKKERVLDASVAYIITNILSDNKARLLAFAENNPLVLDDRPAAAKTGTTDDFRDSWTVGYTPDLVVGVWVGNNNNKTMKAVAGSVGGGQVWHDFMEQVYHDPNLVKDLGVDGQPLQTDFYRPTDVVEAQICGDTGALPGDDCPPESIHTEIFAKGHVPTEKSDLRQKIRVPRGQYCLADSDYPDDAVEIRYIYNYPPELQDWAAKNNKPSKLPPSCAPYVAPTPVLEQPSMTTTTDSGTATTPVIPNQLPTPPINILPGNTTTVSGLPTTTTNTAPNTTTVAATATPVLPQPTAIPTLVLPTLKPGPPQPTPGNPTPPR